MAGAYRTPLTTTAALQRLKPGESMAVDCQPRSLRSLVSRGIRKGWLPEGFKTVIECPDPMGEAFIRVWRADQNNINTNIPTNEIP